MSELTITTQRRGNRWRAIEAAANREAAEHRGRHDFAAGTLNAVYLPSDRTEAAP